MNRKGKTHADVRFPLTIVLIDDDGFFLNDHDNVTKSSCNDFFLSLEAIVCRQWI